MPPNTKKLLADMLEAARLIEQFTRGKSKDDWSADELLRSAVYFRYVVIGEALSQLRTSDSATADQISEASRIVGFRNQIVHGYAQIDDEITWRIVEQKLPVLIRELQQLLAIS